MVNRICFFTSMILDLSREAVLLRRLHGPCLRAYWLGFIRTHLVADEPCEERPVHVELSPAIRERLPLDAYPWEDGRCRECLKLRLLMAELEQCAENDHVVAEWLFEEVYGK